MHHSLMQLHILFLILVLILKTKMILQYPEWDMVHWNMVVTGTLTGPVELQMEVMFMGHQDTHQMMIVSWT